MQPFTQLLTFFGVNRRGNSAAYYPNDHKLTAQERKDYSNKFLRQKGIPVLEHLPFIEDYTEARFQNEKDVASKSVVLFGLLGVAHHATSPKELEAYFKKYDLWEHVSPDERDYLAKENKTDRDNIPITWRAETLNVLFWALGHFNKLPLPTSLCDFTDYKNLPNLETDPTDWIENARLRDAEDILNETDLTYRLHWAARDASLNGRPSPAGLIEGAVMERHFALNWLTMYGDEWDEITTDT